MQTNLNLDPSLLQRYQQMKMLEDSGCMFQYMDDTEYSGKKVTINGQELIHFGSCSYMGLENHPELIQASIEAIKKYGTQTPSSRAVLSSPLYSEAEKLITRIFPGYQVMTQTVTLGHFSVLPLFIKPNDAIILDAYVHNSVRMTSQWCKANGTFVIISKHNNFEHIAYLVKRLKKDGYDKIWYCADGVYSIHGDLLKVDELHSLLNIENDLYAYIDDAHGAGWAGKNGNGYVLGNFDLHPKTIVAVSFAKSFASCGGALVMSDKADADLIRKTGQTLLFSGPVQPAILGALIGSLKLHLSDKFNIYQKELLELIQYFTSESLRLELPIARTGLTPIQLLRIGDVEKTYKILKNLHKSGFFAAAVSYPAVSMDDTGLRITLTRHLDKSDIDNFLFRIKQLIEEL